MPNDNQDAITVLLEEIRLGVNSLIVAPRSQQNQIAAEIEKNIDAVEAIFIQMKDGTVPPVPIQDSTSDIPIVEGNLPIFTLSQLAQYTGRNGMPAYVAVDGIVYDVTNNLAWSGSTHFGLYAGQNLTDHYHSCHFLGGKIEKLPVVGRLIQESGG